MQTKQTQEKRSGSWWLEACRGLNEGGQKVQIPTYKINKYRDVMHNMINIINTDVCYIWKLLRK